MSRIALILLVPLLSAVLSLDVNAKTAATGVVRGHGEVPSTEEGALLPSQISINARQDSEGAHGRIIWIGDFPFVPGDPQDKGGPADPWVIDVTSLTFLADNSAEVCGVVVQAPREEALMEEGCLVFTDNRDTGEDDTIDGVAILAGNILVK